MSIVHHKAGLIQSGAILHESYYRTTRATNEAKSKLNLDLTADYDANIPIARLHEYISFSSSNIPAGNVAIFDLSEIGTTVKPVALYVNNANQDKIFLHVYNTFGTRIITQQFDRNETPITFPAMPLPADAFVVAEAITDLEYLSIVFEPCASLGSINIQSISASQLEQSLIDARAVEIGGVA